MKTANALWGVLTGGVLTGTVLLWCAAGALGQDWPQWRGPNRDNKVTGFKAPAAWPKELTKKWQVTVGTGESSPLLVGDKIYVFGRQGGEEVTLCLNAADGKEIWKDAYNAAPVAGPAATVGGGFKGTRSTPAVAEGKIVTLGVAGVVSCLDAASGKVVWRKDTKEHPQYYTSSSPIIVDGKCIVYVGALTAFDLATGDAKWEWKGGGTPYGSPILMTVDGTKQIVTPTLGALAGVSLDGGKELWQVKVGSGGGDYQSNFSTPIVDGQKVIFSAAPKGKGGGGAGGTFALKIDKKGDGFKETEIWRKELAAHHYHTPVLRDGLLFGTSKALNLFCMSAQTGETLWTDDAKRGQCGSILDAGSVLLSLSSDKELIVMEPNSKEFKEIAKYKVADAETWAVPIVAGNRIFVRDRGGSLTLWTID
jgi:outer membrane protein assembly factor BamB